MASQRQIALWNASRDFLQPVLGHDLLWRIFQAADYAPRQIINMRKRIVTERLMQRVQLQQSVVLAGPFQGLIYPGLEAAGSMLLPKLFGTYESELLEVTEAYCRKQPPLIIDIGCAEGYYAVGFALRVPGARVIAYDISSKARELCAAMAAANGVADRVEVAAACDPAEILRLDFSQGGLVFCDCEGYETQLFSPAIAAHLSQADVLIELHDFIDPTATQSIREAFSQTHEVRLISSISDKAKSRSYQCALVSKTDPIERLCAFQERRPTTMQWAVCSPLAARG